MPNAPITVFPDEPWSAGQGTVDGRPIFVLLNIGAAAVRGHPQLRHRVGVAVPLNAPDADGLPGAEEMDTLRSIEDAVSAALGTGTRAVHVLVITTSGMRELVYHTTEPWTVPSAIESVAARFPSHEVQFIQEDDPEWNVYDHYTPAKGTGDER